MQELLSLYSSLESLLQQAEADRAYHLNWTNEYKEASDLIAELSEDLQQVEEDIDFEILESSS